jgi:small subunit ribosomal protein S6
MKPDLSAEVQNGHTEFYKENITKNGGEIIAAESWGKLTLAYKIDGFSEGVYTLIQFKATTSYVLELEKRYKFNEDVLRFVVVMIDEKKFKLKPRKDPIKRERKQNRKQDDQPDMPETGYTDEEDEDALEMSDIFPMDEK